MFLNANTWGQRCRLLAGALLLPALLPALSVCTANAETAPIIDGRIDAVYGACDFYSPEGVFVYSCESADSISFCLKVHPAANDNVFAPHHTDAPGWGREHWFKSLLQSDKAHVILRDGSGNKVYDFILDYLFDTGVGGITDATRWGSGVWPHGRGWDYDGKSILGVPLCAASSLEWDLENESTGFDPANGYPVTPVKTKYWVSPSPFDPDYGGNWKFDMIYEFQVDKSAFGGEGFGSIEIVDVHNSPTKGPVPIVPEFPTILLIGFGFIGLGAFCCLKRKRGRVESERRVV